MCVFYIGWVGLVLVGVCVCGAGSAGRLTHSPHTAPCAPTTTGQTLYARTIPRPIVQIYTPITDLVLGQLQRRLHPRDGRLLEAVEALRVREQVAQHRRVRLCAGGVILNWVR